MFTKIVEYENFDGQKEKKQLYFNLTKFECVEWRNSKKEGIEQYLKRIIDSEDIQVILKTFKELVLMAYGERIDNKFVKSKEAAEAFSHSEEFSEFVMGLIESEEAAIAFVNGIIPKIEPKS